MTWWAIRKDKNPAISALAIRGGLGLSARVTGAGGLVHKRGKRYPLFAVARGRRRCVRLLQLHFSVGVCED